MLKPTGSLWVNLGDKYAGNVTNHSRTNARESTADAWAKVKRQGMPHKSLMGLPWRYALGCIDQLGLILRAEVVWSKPNGLPESVTDRVRRSHEQFFHFVKEPRYYSAVDEIRERYDGFRPGGVANGTAKVAVARRSVGVDYSGERPEQNPLGKLPSSVWTIPTQPLQVPVHLGVDHFAAFPSEWPRRIILGWSPSGVCQACGEGRRPVVDKRNEQAQATNNPYKTQGRAIPGREPVVDFVRMTQTTTITGYACACPDTTAPTRPAVVADVFGGTGTTAMVARALGRTGLSFDLSHDYSRLARWRTEDAAQRAKVRGEDFRRPEEQLTGQLGMFEETA